MKHHSGEVARRHKTTWAQGKGGVRRGVGGRSRTPTPTRTVRGQPHSLLRLANRNRRTTLNGIRRDPRFPQSGPETPEWRLVRVAVREGVAGWCAGLVAWAIHADCETTLVRRASDDGGDGDGGVGGGGDTVLNERNGDKRKRMEE
ncbi:hypothetical protein E2C01_079843 [Portunus trituberculatus]|uniref:Uncharacterized protein n=1 Tax=Portunus trituberculatus TaxID=210409 RepID=A0A5B7IY16_PORTR|nr:hypothetical protein [Portunus trituberculatus]